MITSLTRLIVRLAVIVGISHIALGTVQAATVLQMSIQDPGTTDFGTTPITSPAIAYLTLTLDVHAAAPNVPDTLRIIKDAGPCTAASPCAVSSLPTVVGEDTGAFIPLDGDEIRITLKDKPTSSVYRYEVFLNLTSNYNGATHMDTMAVDEAWQISVLDAGMLPLDIMAACPISVYANAPGSDPAYEVLVSGTPGNPTNTMPVEVFEPGNEGWSEACGNIRPGVDTVLVLDKSGSMGWSTGSTRARMEVLRDAVEDFVEVWKDLRTMEAGFVPPVNNNDQIGIVFFNQNAPSAWTGLANDLNEFDSNRCNIAYSNAASCGAASSEPDPIDAVNAGGSTSIGDGLLLADSILAGGASERKVMLLMSDGMQNTEALVAVNPADVPGVPECTEGVIYTHPYNDATCDAARVLEHQGDYKIYTATIGPSTVVEPQTNEMLANATGGYYINAEEDDEFLRPFFLQTLQNFLRFSSVETLRSVSDVVTFGAPHEIEIPVTGTTTSLVVNLLSSPRNGLMRLTLQPPESYNSIIREGVGAVRIAAQILGSGSSGYPPGIWKAKVELMPIIGQSGSIGLASEFGHAPYSLVAIGDDLGLHSDLGVVSKRHIPGQSVRLQAKVSEFGTPVTGLKQQPGASVVARLVKPGKTIGDLLSNSNASTTAPNTADQWTAANARLYNALDENPEFLQRDNTGVVELWDDGSAAHGDDVAGDGIYSALYRVTDPGHYNFEFAVKGRAPRVGEFSRQQTESIYVRPVPVSEQTDVATSVSVTAKGSLLTVTFVPKTLSGTRFGPGWRNYFWLTQSNQPPIRAHDNQDGSYTATLLFTGKTPPIVGLHFIDAPVVITDETTVEKLPMPLGKTTEVIPDIRKPKDEDCKGCFDILCRIKRMF